jgi:hypothetical protein
MFTFTVLTWEDVIKPVLHRLEHALARDEYSDPASEAFSENVSDALLYGCDTMIWYNGMARGRINHLYAADAYFNTEFSRILDRWVITDEKKRFLRDYLAGSWVDIIGTPILQKYIEPVWFWPDSAPGPDGVGWQPYDNPHCLRGKRFKPIPILGWNYSTGRRVPQSGHGPGVTAYKLSKLYAEKAG